VVSSGLKCFSNARFDAIEGFCVLRKIGFPEGLSRRRLRKFCAERLTIGYPSSLILFIILIIIMIGNVKF
jgi:hypothetical protein